MLWLFLRSTIPRPPVHETLAHDSMQTSPIPGDFPIQPDVLPNLTRAIGPKESFASFLVPTGDNRADERTLTRADSYSALRNICQMCARQVFETV